MLWKSIIKEDWRDYLLYLVYMDRERLIRHEEKPLLLFKARPLKGSCREFTRIQPMLAASELSSDPSRS